MLLLSVPVLRLSCSNWTSESDACWRGAKREENDTIEPREQRRLDRAIESRQALSRGRHSPRTLARMGGDSAISCLTILAVIVGSVVAPSRAIWPGCRPRDRRRAEAVQAVAAAIACLMLAC